MKSSLVYLVLLISVFLASPAKAEDPRVMADDFFKTIQTGKINDAFDKLFQGSPLPRLKPQAVESLKKQTEATLPMFGKIIGIEMFRREEIGTSIIRLVYIVKQEVGPLVWELYFYKPEAEWYLANIQWNDQFQRLHSVK